MNQTLVLVVLFIAGIATLPWLVRRLQQRQGAQGAGNASTRVLAQAAVGPQQRVVTVEVQHEGQRAVLVLGVSAQQLQCLHVLGSTPALPAASFRTEMAAAQASAPLAVAAAPAPTPTPAPEQA